MDVFLILVFTIPFTGRSLLINGAGEWYNIKGEYRGRGIMSRIMAPCMKFQRDREFYSGKGTCVPTMIGLESLASKQTGI